MVTVVVARAVKLMDLLKLVPFTVAALPFTVTLFIPDVSETVPETV